MTAPWVVVGLGNPGSQYTGTRHNVGEMVIRRLGEVDGPGLRPDRKTRCDTADVRWGSDRVVLGVPHSFMNESGGPVSALVKYYAAPPERLVVVHDEIDLPFNSVRVKLGGGDNGHNGLKSLRSALGTGDFLRVRMGIGRPPGRQAPADFVLTSFPSSLREEVALEVSRAADAVEVLLARGLEAAQNEFNG